MWNIADGYPLAAQFHLWECEFANAKARVGNGQPDQPLLAAAFHWTACRVFREFLMATSSETSRAFFANIAALKQHHARPVFPGAPDAPADLLHTLQEQAYAVARFFFPKTPAGVLRFSPDHPNLQAVEGSVNVMLANVATGLPPYDSSALPAAILAAYLPPRNPSVVVSVSGDTNGQATPGTTLTATLAARHTNNNGARFQWFSCVGAGNVRGVNLTGGTSASYVVDDNNVGHSVCVEVSGLTASVGGKVVATVAAPTAIEIVASLPVSPPAQGGGTGGV